MPTTKKALVLSLCLILLCPGVLVAKTSAKKAKHSAPAKASITLENLKKAYNRKMNSQAKYLAYASKAKAEGYAKVAKLFRAIAKSEGQQAAGHAKVLKALGRKPAARIGKAKVAGTKDNLYAAINIITYEVQAEYPELIKQAETDKNEAAVKSFANAKSVAANDNQLIVSAAANLEEEKAAGDIYICKVCGNVADKLDFQNCPVCNAAAGKYEKVK